MIRVILTAFLILLVTCGVCCTGTVVTSADRIKLEEVLGERPQITKVVQNNNAVIKFLLKSFTPRANGVRLVLSGSEPTGNARADNLYLPDSKIIRIRVSEKIVPIDQLVALVFEIYNSHNSEDLPNHHRRAMAGEISKKDYVHTILRDEHECFLKTRQFIEQQLLTVGLNADETDIVRKILLCPEDYEDFLEYLKRPDIKRQDFNVINVYEEYYDFLRK